MEENSETLRACKKRAMRILNARDMSAGEMRARLAEKGESEEDAQAAVAWLCELRLIDDAAYAGKVVRHYAQKGFGKRRVLQELRRRKVPEEEWEAALENLPEDGGALDRLLRQKLGDEFDRASLKRATDAMARRGYSWPEIKAAVERLRDEQG